MTRRYGDSVRPDVTYRRRPGAYAILPRDGRILLTYQEDPQPEFQLPGGGIDPGEHTLAALHREVIEETGWRIAAPRRLGFYRRHTYMPEYALWAEKICQIWVARPVACLGPPTEPGHSAVWLTAESALARLENHGERDFLRAWLAGS